MENRVDKLRGATNPMLSIGDLRGALPAGRQAPYPENLSLGD